MTQARRPIRSRTSARRPTRIARAIGCHAYPYRHGPLLGDVGRARRRRGASSNWARRSVTRRCRFAQGAPDSIVDTVERDAEHVELARAEHRRRRRSIERIAVHHGDFAAVLPALDPGYDVAFFDGHTPVPALHLTLGKLLRTGGLLITANLNHGGTADACAKALFDGTSWRSALVDDDGETAISVKL